MEDLSYPIGKFKPEPELTDARRSQLIDDIAAAPSALASRSQRIYRMNNSILRTAREDGPSGKSRTIFPTAT